MTGDPHGQGRVATSGPPLHRARSAMILLHGRGGGPEDMLGLADHLALPDIACLAPAAAGRSWWPQSFLAPLAENEPGLSSGLAAVAHIAASLAEEGIDPARTVVLGFSQGACLALEHAARTAVPYRAVIGLSGGLVGTEDAPGEADPALYGHRRKSFDYSGRLQGTAVFLGCHERDPHIPLARVRASAEVFEGMGAAVTTEIYPGAGHAIVEDEIKALRALLNR